MSKLSVYGVTPRVTTEVLERFAVASEKSWVLLPVLLTTNVAVTEGWPATPVTGAPSVVVTTRFTLLSTTKVVVLPTPLVLPVGEDTIGVWETAPTEYDSVALLPMVVPAAVPA